MEHRDVQKMDVMLMRSDSGNKILDIDFSAPTDHGAMMATGQAIACSQAPRAAAPMHPGQQHVAYQNGQMQHQAYAPTTAGVVSMGYHGHMAMPQQPMAQGAPVHSGSAPMASRKLKIVEHHVHRIDTHTKDNGEPEEELVVSNLRSFTLKVAVVDVNEMPIMDSELPLQATLLYENGLPVKQLSNSEPLLVGEPEVVALQGSAVFKLRITSLSSHRDKQRFRIQIAPQNPIVRTHEPALTIVTDPMKSVTKLAHRSVTKDGASGGGAPDTKPPMEGGDGGAASGRNLESVSSTLKQHGEQIGQLQEMHGLILKQLQDLNGLVRNLVAGPAGEALASAQRDKSELNMLNGHRSDRTED